MGEIGAWFDSRRGGFFSGIKLTSTNSFATSVVGVMLVFWLLLLFFGYFLVIISLLILLLARVFVHSRCESSYAVRLRPDYYYDTRQRKIRAWFEKEYEKHCYYGNPL